METSVNNKCKAFTSLEQSKKLTEILPLESADMFYPTKSNYEGKIIGLLDVPLYIGSDGFVDTEMGEIYAWSLAALLDILPKKYYPIKDHETDLILGKPKDKWCVLYWDATGMQDGEQTLADNPVDACVAMIEKLYELNLL